MEKDSETTLEQLKRKGLIQFLNLQGEYPEDDDTTQITVPFSTSTKLLDTLLERAFEAGHEAALAAMENELPAKINHEVHYDDKTWCGYCSANGVRKMMLDAIGRLRKGENYHEK